ncbi:MAG: 23S rRNA (guanosine(2251)-2'-O)-methyltransferase RlmB [Dissulfurimicrobium sp.]|uniref:23S rRNA (guanosine(2251)-2'-O)-methyltransferase RlmB n=1 Tax=Dissulfurimicrobium TaxID=1769732 RepID=UPI001EDA6A4F|nr:23S rRNA (guanosine(2251)-2'-O)-methyltransferase RlmB [Dissulfurimicrobium hydrothermale]UKL14120.1 23S rRNA (guanosine(2251)-2'-O)-methyltransferase RlmB [Dissulfurimicrobium hydrothermale]
METSQGRAPVTIWGIHPVMEFLKTCPDAVREICVLPSFGNRPWQRKLLTLALECGIKPIGVRDFNKQTIAPGAVHQGVTARVMPIWPIDLAELPRHVGDHTPLLVACDQITDPQNLGAIIRSCVAFGAQAVIVPSRSCPEINGVVIKASSGAVAHIRVCEVSNLARALAALKGMGLWVVGLSPEAETVVWDVDLSGPICLVVGAEGEGIRWLIKKTCDITASIPQHPGIGSLNAASAASVFLYEVTRQRRGPTKS